MALVKHRFGPRDAQYPATVFAQYKAVSGTNFPVESLSFDAALDEAAMFQFPAINYGSGNVTVRVRWYADTATSGVVSFGAALCALTPNADDVNIETDAFATENTATDAHLGGTQGQRLHEAVITITNLDSIAAEDWCMLRLRRLGLSDAADTLIGDVLVTEIGVEYSDV